MTESGRARIIIAVWGESYVADLLQVTLPALLAPGNLDALTAAYSCEVRIVTERQTFDAIGNSSSGMRIARQCPLQFSALDELVGGRSYGMSLTHAFHRGFEDLGEAMVGFRLFFLNADFVLAAGSYEAVVKRLEAGKRLVYAPSYCVVAEDIVPALRRRANPRTEVLALTKREMAALALVNLHQSVLSKTVNRPGPRPDVFDQFYWSVDRDTLLGHQMPVALLAMRPTRVYRRPICFWDYGISSEACPGEAKDVIGDSDEFLMIELRARAYNRSGFGQAEAPAAVVARELGRFMTRDQIELGEWPLTLHAGSISAGTDSARAQLDRFRRSVCEHLPSPPLDHRDHPYWTRHVRGFERASRGATYAAGATAHGRSDLGSLYGAVFGRIPFVKPFHPLWSVLHGFSSALRRSGATRVFRGVWVRSDLATPFPLRERDGWIEISASTVFKYGLPQGAAEASLAVFELSWDDFRHFPSLRATLRSGLPNAERAVVFVADRVLRTVPRSEVDALAAAPWSGRRVKVGHTGSHVSAWLHDTFRTGLEAIHGLGPMRVPALAAMTLVLLPLTLLAAVFEIAPASWRRRTSATAEIALAGGGR